jgi:hypothetical protein
MRPLQYVLCATVHPRSFVVPTGTLSGWCHESDGISVKSWQHQGVKDQNKWGCGYQIIHFIPSNNAIIKNPFISKLTRYIGNVRNTLCTMYIHEDSQIRLNYTTRSGQYIWKMSLKTESSKKKLPKIKN